MGYLGRREKVENFFIGAVIITLCVAFLVGVIWVKSYNEAIVFNRLTHQSVDVTTWDAVWVELRVDRQVQYLQPLPNAVIKCKCDHVSIDTIRQLQLHARDTQIRLKKIEDNNG